MRIAAAIASFSIILGLSAAPVTAEVTGPNNEPEFQRPAPGRPGQGRDADKEKEGDKKDSPDAAKPANDEWKQPEITELPATNAAAEAALKRAWESIYSPQGKGMTKLASAGTMNTSFDMGMGPMDIKSDLRIGWEKGKDVEMRILPGENEEAGGMMQMFRRAMASNMKEFQRVLRFVVGLPAFADEFKDARIVSESKEDKTEVLRVWRKEGDKFVSSLITITDGNIARFRTATEDVRFEVTTRGRDKFITKVTTKAQIAARPGMPAGMGGPAEMEFTLPNREKVGDYQVTNEVATKINIGGMATGNMTLKLTEVKVNADVTEELLAMAREPKEEEKPAEKPADKPQEPSGGQPSGDK